MIPTLLTSKFYRPPLRSTLVARPRLLDKLNSNLLQTGRFARKLTLVSAPAGYGKTTLIAEWLNECDRAVNSEDQIDHSFFTGDKKLVTPPTLPRAAWLSLDEGDNDPVRFLAYLIAALKNVNGDIGETALSALQTPQPPDSEILLTSLINDVSTTSFPIFFILDDYHVINTPAIHRQIAFLLDHLPPTLHFAILTREDPLLPIARLRARGQMLEIRQEDLRFTVQETAEFLERAMGLSISFAEINALERCTEGWITGLQMAAISMQGRSDISGFVQAFTGSSRFILDYLIEEVFERQSDQVKNFLLKTSILDRLSGPLCDSVTGDSGSQQLLEGLEQANLFIIPLDQSRGWYRYHRLFADLLRHRLRATYPGDEPELHSRASHWFGAEGLTAEAVQHVLASQDWERAGRLIQSVNSEFLKRGEVQTVIGWFRSLPEEMLYSDPKLCFDYCWPLLLAGQYDTAAPLLDRLELDLKDFPDFLGEVCAAQAYLARSIGNHEVMLKYSKRAMELLPKSSVNSRGIVALNLGLSYWHQGKMRDAEEVLSEAFEAANKTGNHYASLTALIFFGRICAVRGQLCQAEEYFKQAVLQGKEMPINALAFLDLAAIYYEWNKIDACNEQLKRATAISQRSQNDEFFVGCRLLDVRLQLALANIAGAEEILEQALALVRAGKVPEPITERVYATQAYLLMEKGESASALGQKLVDNADGNNFYRYIGITKARTLPDKQARAYLEKFSQLAQANEWGYGLISIRALQATLAETQAEGLDYLKEALQLAEAHGFIRTFVDSGKKLIPLLNQLKKRGVRPDYVTRILAAMPGKTNHVEQRQVTMLEPLSEREIEVLRLITLGMSNREIADELVISTGTAKSHVHNLCGKLGVSSRTEAAVKAKDLGLV